MTNAKSENDNLPVFVWFFGGGLQWGYTAEMEFDGERIARRGVVVVTINYRLGVFGFLSHPEITKENPYAPANFGNLDQQAGIKWVKRNIKAFGGDPENITIGGQSAGGGSVMAQLACEENKELFQKAFIMSGIIGSVYSNMRPFEPLPINEAEKRGEDFFEFLGVKTLEEARKLDAFFIRDKYAEYRSNHPMFFNVLDNRFVTCDPQSLYIEGKCLDVPVMVGNTSDEFPNFIRAYNEEELNQSAEKIFGADCDKFLSTKEAHEIHKQGEYAFVNSIEISAKAINLYEKRDIPRDFYYYRFDADIPGEDDPGTFHSVDLWFFFETLAKCSRPYVGRHYDLARHMCNYLTNFIKTGNPNGSDADGSKMPEWKRYTKNEPYEMVFSKDGATPKLEENSEFKQFLIEKVKDRLQS